MKCPVCQKEMLEEDFGGISIDVCKNGCKGIWFDWSELRRLDEKNEGLGKALQEALQYPRTNDAHRPHLKCPKCAIPMHMHKHRSNKEVNVDECYRCSGFFLDSGELQQIRDHSMSEREEDAYTQQLLNNMPELRKAEADLEQQKLRGEAIRRWTRFLRLSYYGTGK